MFRIVWIDNWTEKNGWKQYSEAFWTLSALKKALLLKKQHVIVTEYWDGMLCRYRQLPNGALE